MAIQCPLCQKQLRLASIRARRFNSQCPKCGEQFVIRIQVLSKDEYKAYVIDGLAGVFLLARLQLLTALCVFAIRFHKFAAWRDKIVDAIQGRLDELETMRQRKRMRKVEMARLMSQGLTKADARQRAIQEGDMAVEYWRVLLTSSREFAEAGSERRRAPKQLVNSARAVQTRQKISILDRLRKLPNRAFGGRSRFALGVVMQVLGLAWLQHNQVFSEIQQTVASVGSILELSGVDVKQLGSSMAKSLSEKGSDPLEASHFHRFFALAGEGQTPFRIGSESISSRSAYEASSFLPGSLGEFLGCLGTSAARLLLVITALCSGIKSIAISMGAAALALLGPPLLIHPRIAVRDSFATNKRIGRIHFDGCISRVWVAKQLRKLESSLR